MWLFEYRNVEYKRGPPGEGLLITGEIANRSGQSFNSIVFRIVVFARSMPLGNATFAINGFPMYQTRHFEVYISQLTDARIVNSISRWEILAESGY